MRCASASRSGRDWFIDWDKDTSGLLLIARTGQAAKRLGESFRDRETEKFYWTVVVGLPPKPEGAIDLPLAKRPGARGDRGPDAGRSRKTARRH